MAESVQSVTKTPIVIDLGKQKKKQIKRFRRGEGRLMSKVEDTFEELKAVKKIAGDAQPVIVVVREKPKKWGRRW